MCNLEIIRYKWNSSFDISYIMYNFNFSLFKNPIKNGSSKGVPLRSHRRAQAYEEI